MIIKDAMQAEWLDAIYNHSRMKDAYLSSTPALTPSFMQSTPVTDLVNVWNVHAGAPSRLRWHLVERMEEGACRHLQFERSTWQMT